jgi:hypothetical protein
MLVVSWESCRARRTANPSRTRVFRFTKERAGSGPTLGRAIHAPAAGAQSRRLNRTGKAIQIFRGLLIPADRDFRFPVSRAINGFLQHRSGKHESNSRCPILQPVPTQGKPAEGWSSPSRLAALVEGIPRTWLGNAESTGMKPWLRLPFSVADDQAARKGTRCRMTAMPNC